MDSFKNDATPLQTEVLIKPKKFLISIVFLLFCINTFFIHYASVLPDLEGKWLINNQTVKFSKAGTLYQISAIEIDDNNWQKLSTSDFIEDPDFLNSYKKYNEFLTKQNVLFKALNKPIVRLKTIDNEIIIVKTNWRNWHQLPFMFWLQISIATLMIISGAWLWCFRQQDKVAQQFLLAGIFQGIIIFPAAIYSTRSLAMSGDAFYFLSHLAHLGLYLYFAAMLTLTWQFPESLNNSKFTKIFYTIMFFIWCIDTLQLFPNLVTSIQIVPLVVLFFTVCIVYLQWKKHKKQPHKLILIKRFLFTIIFGAALFISIIFIPPLFGSQLVLSQGVSYGAFLIVYLSMAVAISRFKLFNFDVWWSESLFLLLSALLVIILNLLLVTIFDLQHTQATLIALALTGWLYFPIRQVFLIKFFFNQSQELNTHLPFVVEEIAISTNEKQFLKSFERCLLKIFSPLHIRHVNPTKKQICVTADSRIMNARLTDQKYSIEMTFADHGNRIFNRYDKATAFALSTLFEHAIQAAVAKEEGIKDERSRISKDIHDSLSGYIIAIMHRKIDPKSAQLARFAWSELRDILSALSLKPVMLSSELNRWYESNKHLISNENISFEFILDKSILDNPITISGIIRLNLGQIIRESVINAYRHAKPTFINVNFSYIEHNLIIKIENNGTVSDPHNWIKGRGLLNIKNRIAQLNGKVNWKLTKNNLIALILSIPLVSEDEVSVFE